MPSAGQVRLLVLLVIVLALAAFFAAGAQRYFTFEHLKAQQAAIDAYYHAHPWRTALGYFALYVTLTGLSLAGAATVLTLVAGAIFGVVWGTVAVTLLLAFGRRGLLGAWLASTFGITFPFTTVGVVMAETFVAMPFLILTVEAGLRSMDRRYEEAARALGASRWRVFIRVTLPLIGPSLFAGAVLCWARALGEFGATITFAGNFPGVTQTMPLAVYLLLGSNQEASFILSLVLLLVSLVVLVGLKDRWLGFGST